MLDISSFPPLPSISLPPSLPRSIQSQPRVDDSESDEHDYEPPPDNDFVEMILKRNKDQQENSAPDRVRCTAIGSCVCHNGPPISSLCTALVLAKELLAAWVNERPGFLVYSMNNPYPFFTVKFVLTHLFVIFSSRQFPPTKCPRSCLHQKRLLQARTRSLGRLLWIL